MFPLLWTYFLSFFFYHSLFLCLCLSISVCLWSLCYHGSSYHLESVLSTVISLKKLWNVFPLMLGYGDLYHVTWCCMYRFTTTWPVMWNRLSLHLVVFRSHVFSIPIWSFCFCLLVSSEKLFSPFIKPNISYPYILFFKPPLQITVRLFLFVFFKFFSSFLSLLQTHQWPLLLLPFPWG